MARPSLIAYFSATAALSLVCACAGPQLERLDGEPKGAVPMTAARGDRTAAAVDGLQRFVRAMEGGQVESAYLLLSAETRGSLQKRAAAVGRRGFDLLRKPEDHTGPGQRALHVADPIATFAMRAPKTLTAGPPPYPAHKPADGRTIEQTVTLVDAAGKKKVVTMRFEGLHWRIHMSLPGIAAPEGP